MVKVGDYVELTRACENLPEGELMIVESLGDHGFEARPLFHVLWYSYEVHPTFYYNFDNHNNNYPYKELGVSVDGTV